MRYVPLIFLLLVSVDAQAQGVVTDTAARCGKTAYGRVATCYVFQDIAIIATSEPVFQGGGTLSCGPWSFDLWTSYELSSGPYGNRGYGDEVDLSFYYRRSVGSFEFEGSGAYYAEPAFGRSSDDLVVFYGDIGRPIALGGVTITPFARVSQWLGLGYFGNQTFVRPGLRFSISLIDNVTLSGDISRSFDLTNSAGVNRSEVTLAKDLGDGLGVTVNAKFTEYLKPVWGFGGSKSW